MEDSSDLSFASILLGFRQKDDKPQVDLESAATAKVPNDPYAPPGTTFAYFAILKYSSI